ncbi:hypothetical protein ACLESD_35000 [Pyxidicoccus sp. 3LFB2]
MKQVLLVVACVLAFGAAPTLEGWDFVPPAYASSCVAREDLSEKAGLFIIRCRRASINREFPSELLGKTLGIIQQGESATYRKAWKLLNDGRFAK